MRLNLVIVVAAVVPAVFLLGACGEGEAAVGSGGASGESAWVLVSEPAGSISVAELKASAVEGDEVVLRGRIGGRMRPMSADSPVFTVVDLGLAHCGQIPGDGCSTPWDYCCETPETMVANTATIQLVDAAGRALGASPAEHGFAPLDEVVVVGVVGARPGGGVLTVRATGVHRVR